MNIIRFTVALLMLLALGGCASTSSPSKNVKTEPSLSDKYVHAVNESNRNRASSVHWVNYPTDEEVAKRLAKKPDDTDDSDAK